MSRLYATVVKRRKAIVYGLAETGQSILDLPAVGNTSFDFPWYVVHTKVRQEQTACENLARQGYAVYLPQIKVLKRSRGRQRAQQEPMFPRYIFVQPGSNAQSIAPVRSTLGVTSIVRFGQEPAVVRPAIMKGIREFEARRNEASDQDISPFQPGERVRVADGPLTGLEGLISDVSQDRVVVLMQLLGQDTRVSLSYDRLLVAN
jgi:transcriptional antiterminator RfaH